MGNNKGAELRAASKSKTAEKIRRAWELHCKGVNQFTIADELGVSQSRVSQYIKKAAADHPVMALDLNERIALSEARWQRSEDEIRQEISRQLAEGRVTREVVRFSDGSEQVKITKAEGVDPALLRALSTHTDRRARQLNNQIAPDANMTAVNVNVVQDFLKQADGGKSLTAADWNHGQQQPDDAIDV